MSDKKILYLLLFLCSTLSYSQTATEVIEAMGKVYGASTPLQYKSNYVLYKDFDSQKAEQIYNGAFYKNSQNEIYMKIGETEILNSKTVNLKISHAEKAIAIADPIRVYFGNFDIKPLLEYCIIDPIKDHKSYWEITLLTLPYAGLPYSKIVIQVSKSYFLQKSTFYYSTAVNFSTDYRAPKVHYPRLEITNTDFSQKAPTPSLFKSQSYFTLSQKKQPILAARLKGYELMEQRNSSNN